MKNSISIDVGDNAELRDIFSGKSSGDKCKLTVEFQINSSDNSTVEGTIESVTPHSSYSDDDGDGDEPDEKEATPDREHPVAIVMKAGMSKERASAY